MKQMGQRCPALNMDGSSDFRKLGHQGKHSVFTDVIVRHPRRRMALDSPDREFAHMTIHTHRHRLTHTHTHVHIPMRKQLHTCSCRDTCQHVTRVNMRRMDNTNNPQVQLTHVQANTRTQHAHNLAIL